MSDGRQIRSVDAGRSDGRASADDRERLRASFRKWWEASIAAYRGAYIERHSTPEAKHEAEVRYAYCKAVALAIGERLRRCAQADGPIARDAAKVISARAPR